MLTTAFMAHRIFSILFLLLIPLPFVALIKSHKQTELLSINIWRSIIRIANISLAAVLITGITIYPYFSSFKLWIAIGLTLALGALLGIISKQLKLYKSQAEIGAKVKHLKRISILGFIYIGIMIVIFGFMVHFYQI